MDKRKNTQVDSLVEYAGKLSTSAIGLILSFTIEQEESHLKNDENGEIKRLTNKQLQIEEALNKEILEFQHVKPGKGAAFVRTKLKNIVNGGVVEKTFRPTEKFPQARIDRVDMQYLYNDGDLFYFMNVETYDQVALNEDTIGDALKFVKDNEMVKVCSINGDVFAVEPPLFVELEITETEPGFKGDTAQGATKPATVETGANVNVPAGTTGLHNHNRSLYTVL